MGQRKATPFSRPLYEPRLSRAERRARGVYYTPPEMVRQIVELTLGPLVVRGSQSPACELRALDPACGAGEFLVAAEQYLLEHRGAEAASSSLFGIDIDAAAIARAKARLPGLPPGNLVVADALASEFFEAGTFDAVVGNPPYVNIRQLAKTLPAARIAELRERFRTARGCFDLYVLFIERALELLKPGGRCGLIVPNKWATLDYARACRELLAEQATVDQVIDYSGSRVFRGASVYPQVVVFRKCEQVGSGTRAPHTAAQWMNGTGGDAYPTMDVESRVVTRPLAEMAKLACGTAGFSAERIARRLIDIEDGPGSGGRGGRNATAGVPYSADFITSGNIDRYAIRLGGVRYLNRTYERPRLPLVSPELTIAKQRLFRSSKIVIAGMSRRLEAAWDGAGLALGVQVYAASECKVDPFYLLAVLNSKLMSFLFAMRFAAKRLAGGYLAINKGQLAKLPIVEGAKCTSVARRLSELAKVMTGQAGGLSYEAEVDRLVYRLYGLSDTEIARVEGHFSQGQARAAA